MGWYKAVWNYRSALWHEPITAGQLLDLTDEQAAALLADSPGMIEPVEVEATTAAERKAKEDAKADAKAKAEAERSVDEPANTTARRGPARKRSGS